MAFVDEARIFVKAGGGGKGCDSFFREKHFRYPRPDGGDGGNGGSIVFVASSRIQTLLDYRFKQHYKGGRGGHGGSKGKTGKCGADEVLKVPTGTIIRDHDTGLLIKDLVSAGQEVVVVKGTARNVKRLADELIGTKGVKHGKLVTTTSGKGLN